jgi:Fanconi anemia group M protein
MSNDLSRGLFPARDVKLLIVDEAHRAQGDYAYCLVARELARSATIVRIVALSGEAFFDRRRWKTFLISVADSDQ